MKWIAALSIVVSIATGYFAFLQNQAADAAIAQTASLKAETAKAQADMKAAQAERDGLRKETADLKVAAQELQNTVDLAGRFLESEKAVSARLREDLAMTTARLAAAGSRQARPSDLPPGSLPQLAPIQRPVPIVVRAAQGGSAVGVAAPAR